MESRRMTTRSSRRAAVLPVSPIKQAVMANPMGGGKVAAKRSARKVLADKTNATPVAGMVGGKSGKRGVGKGDQGRVVMKKEEVQEVSTPQSGKVRSVEQVVPQGEDLLRSLVHSSLSIVQTPTGLACQRPEAETPQFGVPLSSYQDKEEEDEAAAMSDVSSASANAKEVIDMSGPAEEASPQSDVTTVSKRLSSAWVGRDVDDVTEVGEDDDSNCSKLVNVSSPGVSTMVGSPAPAAMIQPPTPRTADVKWQRRESQKVKEWEGECGFNYYDQDEGEDYEGCDEYDGEDDFGQVIDCDDICQGISRIQVAEGLPEHKGRHIRFNYNSDDEVDVEEVDVMRLRGLPTPMGKHLRFPEAKEESSP